MQQSAQTNHARRDGLVRDFIDQDEAAGGAALLIAICGERLLNSEGDACNAIERQGIAAVLLLRYL